MDIVSFETAKRLKEAGFPQPEPKIGQFWHHILGHYCYVISDIQEGNLFSGICIGKEHENPAEACASAWLAINEK